MPQQAAQQALPSIDQLLQRSEFKQLVASHGRSTVVEECRAQTQQLRMQMPADLNRAQALATIHRHVQASLHALFAPSLRPLLNLTGIVLHTNLGRAPYPQAAIDAMLAVSRSATNLEYNLDSGTRGRRDDHIEDWICRLTGAEAATTVNNNAAAVMLVLNTLAAKRNVVVSRGELIEIGGSFRLPAIMQSAGCKLREVGTTNRTHLSDYAQAIGRKTAALMKVHTSNYEVQGFSKSVSARELSSLAKQHGLPLYDDLGSGCLVDLSHFGLPSERTVREALNDGTDIVTFSGDKLLGGPQCGIIAGSREWIRQIDKNPMKRAMRLDKITLAALEAVLKLYANPDTLASKLPALTMLSRPTDQIQRVARRLCSQLQPQLQAHYHVAVEPCQSQIGSGALPTRTLPSHAVVVRQLDRQNKHSRIEQLAESFRQLPLPVIGRVHNRALWFDCRTLFDIDTVANPLAGAQNPHPDSASDAR